MAILKQTKVSLRTAGFLATLRRIVVRDEDGKRITFLTNNFALVPELIAKGRYSFDTNRQCVSGHARYMRAMGQNGVTRTSIKLPPGTI